MYEDAHLDSDFEDRCNGGIPVDDPDYGEYEADTFEECKACFYVDCECDFDTEPESIDHPSYSGARRNY